MSTPFAEQMRPIIAAAMDGGWTTGDLRDAFEQVVEFERDARMNAVAAKVYGRSAHEYDEGGCQGHPAGPGDPMGETVYCDGSCRS